MFGVATFPLFFLLSLFMADPSKNKTNFCGVLVRWLTGDQIIALITHWSPDVTSVGNKTSHYIDGPFSLDNFYTSITRHMDNANTNLATTSLRYAIVNTDVANQPGLHWFVVAYCVGSEEIP